MRVFKINADNSHLLNKLNGGVNATILFFHPSCSHCHSMKPDWEKMKNKMKSRKRCNIYEVNGENMENIHHPMKDTIQGFPTILNVNNGKIDEFDKERNSKNMIDFVLANLGNNRNENSREAKRNLNSRGISFNLNGNKLIKKKRVTFGKPITNSIKIARAKYNNRRSKRNFNKNKKNRRNKTIKRLKEILNFDM